MNIVYLIGNGFDLNLGMETSYRNFYKYYLELPTGDDPAVVKLFKEKLRSDCESSSGIDKWSDLETMLGAFLENTDEQGAIKLHKHLMEHLLIYIEQQENTLNIDETQKNKFYEYLINPHLGERFTPEEELEIDKYVSVFMHREWDIKLITFNYTKSIERLLGVERLLDVKDKKIQIGTHHDKYAVNLSAIEHIHGFTRDRMILGVNDISQIANDKFRAEIGIVERYVKSDCNKTYGLGHDKKCQRWIQNASLICLFGLSFGETDRKWWNIVGNMLQKNRQVIIFEHVPSDKLPGPNQGPDGSRMKRDIINRFLSKIDMNDDWKDKVKKNIHVTYSPNMFKFDIAKIKASNDKKGDIKHLQTSHNDDIVYVQNVMGC